MSKISIGRERRGTNESREGLHHGREANTFFIIGCVVICLMLFPTVSVQDTGVFREEAVQVMSGAVDDGEKLVKPSEDASLERKEWSIYDYIGRMFAEILFGGK